MKRKRAGLRQKPAVDHMAVLRVPLQHRGGIKDLLAIFVIFTVGFYVVPAMWTGLGRKNAGKAMSMDKLLGEGIATHVGWCKGRDAIVQALILPVLILGWGIAVVSIAALA